MVKHNISKREQTLLAATIVLAIIFFTFKFGIDPVIGKWRKTSKQISVKKTKFIKNTRLLERYGSLTEEYKQYPNLLKASGDEEEELNKSFSAIERLSKKSSCPILNIKPRVSKKSGTHKEISFDVTVSGSIKQISQFIYEIETSKDYLRIRRFSITAKSTSKRELKAGFRITRILFM